MRSRETDFTTGKPSQLILSFYWPLLMTSMLQQFYNFADTWIVGQGLGDNALAAVGNMGSLFFLIVGFSFGIANGFGVLIAQSYGAGNIEALKHRMAGAGYSYFCIIIRIQRGVFAPCFKASSDR